MPSGDLSDFKELLRSRTDLVQLVAERVSLQSRRGGREFVGLCPFHDDHNPSLRVDPDRQSYKCWSCGEGGDCFAFVQKIENVGFRDALELLATRAGLELPRRSGAETGDGRPTRKELLDILAWAEAEYHTVLRTSSEGTAAREYLQSRGFSEETVQRFRLGFSPGDGQFLQRRGRGRFNGSQLAAARLAAERTDGSGFYDYFRGRLMFPIRDASARNVAFGGRVLPGPAADKSPKYVNSADSPLFAKNKLVFALDLARQAIADRGFAVVMEGYADCIMAHQFGITNSVATLGTALTENHVSVLKRFTRKVVLVFDGDRAGREAAEKSLPRFLAQEVDLRILTLTNEKDPADFLIAHGSEAFLKLVESAVEAWEYKLNLCMERFGLASVDARDQVVRETIEVFKQSPALLGSGRRDIVLNRLAFRTGLPERRVRELLAQSRRQKSPVTIAAAATGRADSATHSLEPSGHSPLESELLEIILSDPKTIVAIREQITLDDLKHEQHRRLLEACYRLLDEGEVPEYEKLMSAVEDSELKGLVVTLDASSKNKQIAGKLSGDEYGDGGPRRKSGSGQNESGAVEKNGPEEGPSEFLLETIGRLKRRRRAEAHEVSKGRVASQAGPAPTLDPAQKELLRRAMEIHGERATSRTTI